MIVKKKSYAFRAIFLVISYLLSACGAVGLQSVGNQEQSVVQVQSQEIAYTGVIEAINGSQWMINGVEVTVEPSVIQGGPFIVGDTVKVEGTVSSDGLVVMQVQSPTAADLTGLPALGDSVDAVADDNNNSNINTNSDDDDNQNTNLNTNNNTNGDDDDDDNTNLNANTNTNGDDDDNTNLNANNNTNGDDDDSNNNNTNDDDDDDDNSNNTNSSDDDDDNSNGS